MFKDLVIKMAKPIKVLHKFTDHIYEELSEYIALAEADKNFLPSIIDFALNYNYSYKSMLTWRDKNHPEYKGDIYLTLTDEIMDQRYKKMVDNGLTGGYNAQFTKYRLGIERGEWETKQVEQQNTNINAEVKNDDDRTRIIRDAIKGLSSEDSSK